MATCDTTIMLNDIGTVFIFTFYECVEGVDTAVDISGADIEVKLRKPDNGEILEKTGVFYTDGTDGKAYYKTIAGDIDTLGKWEAQGKIVESVGVDEFNSTVIKFKVAENI